LGPSAGFSDIWTAELLCYDVCDVESADATLVLMASCASPSLRSVMHNPVSYFEIPVIDLERATTFYSFVFETTLECVTLEGYAMALFPNVEGARGATGALVKGDVYVPSKNGAILYFRVVDMDRTLARAQKCGAIVLYPKKDTGPGSGFVAEFEDSEGNRIALSQAHR
jgi:uncharacterized protein